MGASTDVLADTVRAKRTAVDNDLELLRVRAESVDPRRLASRWVPAAAPVAVPIAVGATALWLWRRRRRSVTSLRDLLRHSLIELYRAERYLVPALGRMRRAASNPDLESIFARHFEETKSQARRLERALRSVGDEAREGRSASMAAIEDEGRRVLNRERDRDVRDATLIAMAQRIEHVEIANYGTARTFADTLGYTHASELLQQTLEEERAMDEQLTRLAERFVNPETIR